MNRKLIVHAEARVEILEALNWYAQRSAVAASAFVHELASMVTLATRSPASWPRISGNIRSLIFPRFPFSLIFRTKGKTLEEWPWPTSADDHFIGGIVSKHKRHKSSKEIFSAFCALCVLIYFLAVRLLYTISSHMSVLMKPVPHDFHSSGRLSVFIWSKVFPAAIF